MLIQTNFRKIPVIGMGRPYSRVQMTRMEGGNIFSSLGNLFSGAPKLLSRLFSGTNLKQVGENLLNSALERGRDYALTKGTQLLNNVVNNPMGVINSIRSNPEKVVKQETDKLTQEFLKDVIKPVKKSVKNQSRRTKKQIQQNAMDILAGMGHDGIQFTRSQAEQPTRGRSRPSTTGITSKHSIQKPSRKKVMDMMGRGLIPY